jgi:hypothetical protein
MKLDSFHLERYFAEHEFTAPYIMCSSDCESLNLGDLLALEPEASEKFSSSSRRPTINPWEKWPGAWAPTSPSGEEIR